MSFGVANSYVEAERLLDSGLRVPRASLFVLARRWNMKGYQRKSNAQIIEKARAKISEFKRYLNGHIDSERYELITDFMLDLPAPAEDTQLYYFEMITHSHFTREKKIGNITIGVVENEDTTRLRGTTKLSPIEYDVINMVPLGEKQDAKRPNVRTLILANIAGRISGEGPNILGQGYVELLEITLDAFHVADIAMATPLWDRVLADDDGAPSIQIPYVESAYYNVETKGFEHRNTCRFNGFVSGRCLASALIECFGTMADDKAYLNRRSYMKKKIDATGLSDTRKKQMLDEAMLKWSAKNTMTYESLKAEVIEASQKWSELKRDSLELPNDFAIGDYTSEEFNNFNWSIAHVVPWLVMTRRQIRLTPHTENDDRFIKTIIGCRIWGYKSCEHKHCILYGCIANEHFYRCTRMIDSLKQTFDGKQEVLVDGSVIDKFAMLHMVSTTAKVPYIVSGDLKGKGVIIDLVDGVFRKETGEELFANYKEDENYLVKEQSTMDAMVRKVYRDGVIPEIKCGANHDIVCMRLRVNDHDFYIRVIKLKELYANNQPKENNDLFCGLVQNYRYVLSQRYMSHLSDDARETFGSYSRCGITAKFCDAIGVNSIPEGWRLVKIDMRKSYPSQLFFMDKIPIGMSIDHFVKWDNSKEFDVNVNAFYVVRRAKVATDDEKYDMYCKVRNEMDILFESEVIICTQHALGAFANICWRRGVDWKKMIIVQAIYVPSIALSNDEGSKDTFACAIKNVCSMKEVSEEVKKQALVFLTGVLQTKYGVKESCSMFKSISDAKLFHDQVYEYLDDDKKKALFYIGSNKLKVELQKSWFPIATMMLDMVRSRMAELCFAMEQEGCKIMSIHVDALYVLVKKDVNLNLKTENIMLTTLSGESGHSKWDISTHFGCWKTEELFDFEEIATRKPTVIKPCVMKLYKGRELEEMTMKDEYDMEEAKQILASHDNRMFVKAPHPGSGKTYLCTHMRLKGETLVCVHNNYRKAEWEGFNITTSHYLLGGAVDIIGNEKVKDKVRKIPEGVKCIIFDEFYCYSARQIGRACKLMKKESGIVFLGNGCRKQNKPIDGWAIGIGGSDRVETKYDAIIAEMFGCRLTLYEMKRFAVEKRPGIAKCCDLLWEKRDEDMRAVSLECCALGGIEVKKGMPVEVREDEWYICATHAQIHELQKRAKFELKVVSFCGDSQKKVEDTITKKKITINSNTRWDVLKKDAKGYCLKMCAHSREMDLNKRIVDEVCVASLDELFRAANIATGHCVLGATLKGKINIFPHWKDRIRPEQCGCLFDAAWLNTVITRSADWNMTMWIEN